MKKIRWFGDSIWLVLLGSAVMLLAAGCGGSTDSVPQPPSGPVPVSNAAVGDGGVPSFYVWTSRVPGTPGQLLRQQPLDANLALDNSDPSQNVRMLYTSTDGVDGKTPVAVSGAVYFPKGTPPANGWPVIAWTHGTVGMADVCAQSYTQRSDRDKAYLGTLLAQGYAVVATDYQGLGTPGPHPYVLTRAEAYSTLDNLRAALAMFPGVLANKVVLVGQSQGSGATIATLQYAPTYAPDVHIVGGVATGVAFGFSGTNPAPQIPAPVVSNALLPVSGDALFDMFIWLGTAPAENPAFDITPYLSDSAKPLFAAATKNCVDALETMEISEGITEANYLKARPPVSLVGPVLGRLPTPIAGFSLKVPLFTGTGLADSVTGTPAAYNFISTACSLGADIEWHYYPGLTHSGAVNGSLVDSLPFIKKVLAGEPVVSNCSSLVVPGPLQPATPGLPFNT
ncbi:alpha/beta fold hydrolase [Burkholderia cepacia]|uniref:alpha/beta fold hydrolase n=1 Tax=Burkholderia cepacia TaxID=292 RepID=UPI00398EB685